MDSGIYALYWPEQDLIYIGQSSQLLRRKYEHFRLLHTGSGSNKKLKQAFDSFGDPEFHILEYVPINQLDAVETKYIHEFDAVNCGLNVLENAFGSGNDTTHAAAKFSKEQILQAAEYLVKGLPLAEILSLTGISKPVLSSILNQTRHTWLPTEIKEALAVEAARRAIKVAKDSSNKDYYLKSPTGKIYKINNVAEFARQNNLLDTKLNEVLRNKRKQHCGWTRPTESELQNGCN